MIAVVPLIAVSVSIIAYYAIQSTRVSLEKYREMYEKKAAEAEDMLFMEVSPLETMKLGGTFAAGAFLLCFVMNFPIFLNILVSVAFLFAPYGYFVYERKKRLRDFYQQIPEMLASVKSSVLAGYSLPMAFADASKRLKTPASQELGFMSMQIKLGVPFSKALFNMGRRMPSEEMEILTQSLSVAEKTGGNLANIIASIETTVRERIMLKKKLKAMTSQVRTEINMSAAMPVFLFILMKFTSPELIDTFMASDLFPYIIGGAVAWMAIGFYLMGRLMKPKFLGRDQ